MDQPNIINMDEPPKKKGSYLKWGLIGCGGLLVVSVIVGSLLLYMLSKRMNMEPGQVEAAAQEILRFDKPEGFKGVWSMSMMGVKIAMLAHSGGEPPMQGSIVLMEFPGGEANADQMQRQFREAMKRQGQGEEEVSEQRAPEKFTVRGAETDAQVGVIGGRNGAEKSLQYMLTLKGASGSPVLVAMIGPEKVMTHDWVQNFLNSVQ